MRKYIQRGLVAAVMSGGFVLLGSTMANADTDTSGPLGLGGVVHSVTAAISDGDTSAHAVAGNGGDSGDGGNATSDNTATSGDSGDSGDSGSTGGNTAHNESDSDSSNWEHRVGTTRTASPPRT